MANTESKRRGLTRAAIVARALDVGGAEGLEAVSLRRLALELGVTPMALYRHVSDKQDLINAMTDEVLAGFDLSDGMSPSMSWQDRVRLAITNFKKQMEARPLALPLSIAYTGEGAAGFWRMSETLLAILLDAGFERRRAIVWIRVISNLLSGYLLLISQDAAAMAQLDDARQLEVLRKRFELVLLGLPAAEFPTLTASSAVMPEVWLSNPDQYWTDTVDLLVLGLEAMLARER
ncbi:MAG TPA: TetR family transcriptional regulator [Candidatus Dormibacteraeota bacterium]